MIVLQIYQKTCMFFRSEIEIFHVILNLLFSANYKKEKQICFKTLTLILNQTDTQYK